MKAIVFAAVVLILLDIFALTFRRQSANHHTLAHAAAATGEQTTSAPW